MFNNLNISHKMFSMFTFVPKVATSVHASNHVSVCHVICLDSFCTQNIWAHFLCVCVRETERDWEREKNCSIEEESITDWGVTIASLRLNGLDEFFQEGPRVIF